MDIREFQLIRHKLGHPSLGLMSLTEAIQIETSFLGDEVVMPTEVFEKMAQRILDDAISHV